MNIIHLLFVVVTFLAGCSHFRMDQNKTPPPSSPTVAKENFGGLFDVYSIKLNNGFQAWVIEDSTSPTFAIQTWFQVGSKDEVKNFTGLAHLFEHMMFKGTTMVPEGQFDKILEQAGAEGLNAFTTNDVTVYIQEMPDDALELILKLESDRMVNLIVNENSFKTEREVVQNERRFRKENSPEGTLYQKMFELAYRKHPYRWPVIGYEEDLNRMNAQDASAFYKKYYAPNNAKLVISGNVKVGKVADLLQKYYGSLPRVGITRNQDIVYDGPRTRPVHDSMKLNIKNDILFMTYNVPEVTNPDALPLSFLETLWCGGKSGRIHQSLVETGVASSASCGLIDLEHPGLFVFQAYLQKGKSAEAAEKIILDEINRARKSGFLNEELKRAKNFIQFSFYSGLETNKARSQFLGRNLILYNDLNRIYSQYEKLLQTTPQELDLVLNKYFHPNKRVSLVGRPK